MLLLKKINAFATKTVNNKFYYNFVEFILKLFKNLNFQNNLHTDIFFS